MRALLFLHEVSEGAGLTSVFSSTSPVLPTKPGAPQGDVSSAVPPSHPHLPLGGDTVSPNPGVPAVPPTDGSHCQPSQARKNALSFEVRG